MDQRYEAESLKPCPAKHPTLAAHQYVPSLARYYSDLMGVFERLDFELKNFCIEPNPILEMCMLGNLKIWRKD